MAGHSRQAFEQSGKGLGGPLDSRRNDAAGDDASFEKSEVVAGKVEDLGNGRNVGGSLQVDAGQANHRLVDDAEPRLDRRPGLGEAAGPTDREIDRDVEDARTLGKIHAEEEDVAPSAVRKVHADGRGLSQDGEDRIAQKELGTQAQGIVVRVPGSKHPLVAAHTSDAAADLIGEGLEAERAVAGGQRTGDGGAGAMLSFGGEKDLNGFLKAAFEQVFKTGKWDERGRGRCRKAWNMKAMDGVKKEERPDALVEVVAASAEIVEFAAFGKELVECQAPAQGIEGDIALVPSGGDDCGKAAHEEAPPPIERSSRSAKSSSICQSTSLRSRPLSASAS